MLGEEVQLIDNFLVIQLNEGRYQLNVGRIQCWKIKQNQGEYFCILDF